MSQPQQEVSELIARLFPARTYVFCPYERDMKGVKRTCGWSWKNKDSEEWYWTIDDTEVKGGIVVEGECDDCTTMKFMEVFKQGKADEDFFSFRIHELNEVEIYIAKQDLRGGASSYFRFLVQDPALAKLTNGSIDLTSYPKLNANTLTLALEFVCTKKYNTKRENYQLMIALEEHCRVYVFARRILFQELMDASYTAASLLLETLKGSETISSNEPVSFAFGTFWSRLQSCVEMVYETFKEEPRRNRFGEVVPNMDKLKEELVSLFCKIMEKREHKSDVFSYYCYEELVQKCPEFARDTLIMMDRLRDEE